ncbi:hypothetical protein JAAARDRAFT_210064 [Jaapia argillacea MUCL 33604]|uniref:Uncharacterized protein n=1 Tax=Jaapia argillacea MUCL 33604 TaxID=933084 RepID=A0A067PHY5_9AGAM|nr:hypothetical protein JAAARDRAFT_210064 [Jaapia argillacea MUCL 33604]
MRILYIFSLFSFSSIQLSSQSEDTAPLWHQYRPSFDDVQETLVFSVDEAPKNHPAPQSTSQRSKKLVYISQTLMLARLFTQVVFFVWAFLAFGGFQIALTTVVAMPSVAIQEVQLVVLGPIFPKFVATIIATIQYVLQALVPFARSTLCQNSFTLVMQVILQITLEGLELLGSGVHGFKTGFEIFFVERTPHEVGSLLPSSCALGEFAESWLSAWIFAMCVFTPVNHFDKPLRVRCPRTVFSDILFSSSTVAHAAITVSGPTFLKIQASIDVLLYRHSESIVSSVANLLQALLNLTCKLSKIPSQIHLLPSREALNAQLRAQIVSARASYSAQGLILTSTRVSRRKSQNALGRTEAMLADAKDRHPILFRGNELAVEREVGLNDELRLLRNENVKQEANRATLTDDLNHSIGSIEVLEAEKERISEEKVKLLGEKEKLVREMERERSELDEAKVLVQAYQAKESAAFRAVFELEESIERASRDDEKFEIEKRVLEEKTQVLMAREIDLAGMVEDERCSRLAVEAKTSIAVAELVEENEELKKTTSMMIDEVPHIESAIQALILQITPLESLQSDVKATQDRCRTIERENADLKVMMLGLKPRYSGGMVGELQNVISGLTMELSSQWEKIRMVHMQVEMTRNGVNADRTHSTNLQKEVLGRRNMNVSVQ